MYASLVIHIVHYTSVGQGHPSTSKLNSIPSTHRGDGGGASRERGGVSSQFAARGAVTVYHGGVGPTSKRGCTCKSHFQLNYFLSLSLYLPPSLPPSSLSLSLSLSQSSPPPTDGSRGVVEETARLLEDHTHREVCLEFSGKVGELEESVKGVVERISSLRVPKEPDLEKVHNGIDYCEVQCNVYTMYKK